LASVAMTSFRDACAQPGLDLPEIARVVDRSIAAYSPPIPIPAMNRSAARRTASPARRHRRDWLLVALSFAAGI
jgi:hypothetical protein